MRTKLSPPTEVAQRAQGESNRCAGARRLIALGASISQRLLQELANPQPIHIPHDRHQPAPAADVYRYK
jgi:hypothetical protein